MFKIRPLSKDVQAQIRDLQPAYRNKLSEAFKAIEENPKWAPNNKIGQFKGDLKHLGWHYRLTYSIRIHYEIDEENFLVTITYIGPHPNY